MLRIGAVIEVSGQKYRVIEIKNDSILLIQMENKKYHFLKIPRGEAEQLPCMTIDEEPINTCFMVTDDELRIIKEKQAAIQIVLKGLEDISNLERKKCFGIKAYMRTFGVSRQTAHKDIRRYLQSGFNMYALRDGRKSHGNVDMFSGRRGGRRFADGSIRIPIDPELEKKAFEEGFRILGRSGSVKRIIDYLNLKYFGISAINDDGVPYVSMPPRNEQKNKKRFRRYCRERTGNIPLHAFKRIMREQQITEGGADGN